MVQQRYPRARGLKVCRTPENLVAEQAPGPGQEQDPMTQSSEGNHPLLLAVTVQSESLSASFMAVVVNDVMIGVIVGALSRPDAR
jgi:hypothetical protein